MNTYYRDDYGDYVYMLKTINNCEICRVVNCVTYKKHYEVMPKSELEIYEFNTLKKARQFAKEFKFDE